MSDFDIRSGSIATPYKGASVIDCRIIANPSFSSMHDGRSGAVLEYVALDREFERVLGRAVKAMAGGSRCLMFACEGGIHRSVACAEHFSTFLRAMGFEVTVTHENLTAEPEDGTVGS